jgi:ribosomal protein L28
MRRQETVFSEYFRLPCQSSFHQLLHNHPHLSSGVCTIGQKWPQYLGTYSHPTNNNNKKRFKHNLTKKRQYSGFGTGSPTPPIIIIIIIKRFKYNLTKKRQYSGFGTGSPIPPIIIIKKRFKYNLTKKRQYSGFGTGKLDEKTPLQLYFANYRSLNHGAEPFLRSRHLCSYSRTSQHFMEPEGSLPCPQEPSTGPHPEPDQSNPSYPILSL